MTALELLQDAAATYRLTVLVTRDALTQGVRDRIVEQQKARLASTGDEIVTARRYGQDVAEAGGPVAYLVQCPWCASIWIGAGVVLARRLLPIPWGLTARGLAMSAATGWLADRS